MIGTLARKARSKPAERRRRLGRQGFSAARPARHLAAESGARRTGERRGAVGQRRKRQRAPRRSAGTRDGLSRARRRQLGQRARGEGHRRKDRAGARQHLRHRREYSRARGRADEEAAARGAAGAARHGAALEGARDDSPGPSGHARSRRDATVAARLRVGFARLYVELEFHTLAKAIAAAEHGAETWRRCPGSRRRARRTTRPSNTVAGAREGRRARAQCTVHRDRRPKPSIDPTAPRDARSAAIDARRPHDRRWARRGVLLSARAPERAPTRRAISAARR